MTLNYGLFDVSDPENPDRVYSAALLSRILSKHIRDGIVHGDSGELAVSASDPPAMSVQVGTGTAMIRGRFCENDAALTLSVPAAHATYPRIDRVVVRLNASPARTIDILCKKGTPAPSPVPPGLTRTPETWELSLAQISVAAGATMVQAANITDERGNASLCGVAAPAYVPSSQVEVVGAINMQGHALTGLPAPSGATDAAQKGYVDSEIAGKIGGFGISQIAIDADKNWNGKALSNTGLITGLGVQAIQKKIYAPSDTVIYNIPDSIGRSSTSFSTTHTITVPQGYMQSTCRLRFELWGVSAVASARILHNGRQIYSTQEYGSTPTWKAHDCLVVEPGDVFELQILSSGSGTTVYARNFQVCGEEDTYTRVFGSPDVTW